MPLERQFANNNLIQSTTLYAMESIPQNTTYVQGRSKFTIVQSFKVEKSILENLVKILYDSEIDNGLYGGRYSIINASCSGTIYGNFFYLPYTSIEELTTFLSNLYAALYSSEFRLAGAEYMTIKIQELAKDMGGSITKPWELINNINQRRLYTTDFVKIIFNLQNESQSRDDMKDINRMMIDERSQALVNPFESYESIDRLLRMRLNFSAEEAAANELDTERDELYELIRETRNTGDENIHLRSPTLSSRINPVNYRETRSNNQSDVGPKLRPRRNQINYKETRTYRKRGLGVHQRSYSRFLNVYARDNRRSQILNGLADSSNIQLFDNLHNNIRDRLNERRRNL